MKGASIRAGSALAQEEDGLGEHAEQEEDSAESTQPGETLEKLEARVQAINHRIARAGGTTGGWHPREHDMFVTIMAQVGIRPGTKRDYQDMTVVGPTCTRTDRLVVYGPCCRPEPGK